MATEDVPPPGDEEEDPNGEEPEDEVEEFRMSLTEHLDELRFRLIYAGVSVGAVAIVAYLFKEPLLQFLLTPMQGAMEQTTPIAPTALDQTLELLRSVLVDEGLENGRSKQDLTQDVGRFIDRLRERILPTGLVFLHPVEAFFSYLKLSLLTGLIVGMPAVIFQVWKFVMPALYRNERTYIVNFLTFGSTLFYIGVAFCYLVVLPIGLRFLVGIGLPLASPMFSIGNYISFAMLFMLVFGLAFEMPLAMLFLVKMGLVEHRTLIEQWKFVLVGAFGIGALFTPPDLFTQLAMATAVTVLYGFGLVLTYVVTRREARAREEEGE